jgi:hypothetical protein
VRSAFKNPSWMKSGLFSPDSPTQHPFPLAAWKFSGAVFLYRRVILFRSAVSGFQKQQQPLRARLFVVEKAVDDVMLTPKASGMHVDSPTRMLHSEKITSAPATKLAFIEN